MMTSKPGRNDPCPCGSGKKFKKCCQAKSEPIQSTVASQEACNQLVALFNSGRYAELESQSRLRLEQYPESGFVWMLLGASFRAQGKQAVPALQKAAEYLPDDAGVHSNLGVALKEAGRLDEAVSSYRRALEINPDYAEAHSNLGNALHAHGQLADAVSSYRRALQLNPGLPVVHNNLGNALKELAQLDAAIACYRRALALKPDYAEAHNNLGNAQKDLGQLEDALASYRRALEIMPDYAMAHSNLLFTHNHLPDQPSAMLLAEARRFGEVSAQKARPFSSWNTPRDPERCLRVGLVSGDLRKHPVGYFVESMLSALASGNHRLELIAYSTFARDDELTGRIKACCKDWHSAVGLSDEALARQIHDDGIDILLDLSGHTAHNRLPMFAWKPAPVQASWLGYSATTGVTAIDYLIADPWVLPATEEAAFTEKIWRLPETRLCFTVPDVAIDVAPLPALKNGFITFGCFNNLSKLSQEVVALWANVLDAVPGSQLFLKAYQLNEESVRQNILDRFNAHGVGKERLILEGPDTREKYLAAYHRVDIALDPFPFPGGTTTVEGLWMGVPTLTLTGQRFLARQGVGILANAGLPQWIASDADDYLRRAVLHAGDLQHLSALRKELRQQVLVSPIFDAPRFANKFAIALRGMWHQWCNAAIKQSTETL